MVKKKQEDNILPNSETQTIISQEGMEYSYQDRPPTMRTRTSQKTSSTSLPPSILSPEPLGLLTMLGTLLMPLRWLTNPAPELLTASLTAPVLPPETAQRWGDPLQTTKNNDDEYEKKPSTAINEGNWYRLCPEIASVLTPTQGNRSPTPPFREPSTLSSGFLEHWADSIQTRRYLRITTPEYPPSSYTSSADSAFGSDEDSLEVEWSDSLFMMTTETMSASIMSEWRRHEQQEETDTNPTSEGSKATLQGVVESFYDRPVSSLLEEDDENEAEEKTESSNPPQGPLYDSQEETDKEEVQKLAKKEREREY
ncbi:uncharacterized protein BT62DRAFT_1002908 [Guyanagaster necrorhizus]|uniref:Uncharacterized protein n=1 Tax=Guyanagaster necrorhizus TaxID=856835 RepID=A0A9P8AV97_9AGAR|nr:uncharacterized protein BT62DRAFT_1002908 [Guyanagaster necrorhizus MCA 3950]KAG7449329.1 hypothetical protein BT62DRAFT_1002908 [Guyanagaster necrorhizus MCA 3950]